MRRLFDALRADRGSAPSAAVEERLRDYAAVLLEWNGGLNLNLRIYTDFRELGLLLEGRYRELGAAASTPDDNDIECHAERRGLTLRPV